MKTTENVRFTTVGKLLKELKEYDEESREYSVAVWIPDDDESNFCVVSMALDDDGDLCIDLEDMSWSEGYFNVQELIDELEGYDKKTKVYLAGCGLYLSFEEEGGIFCEPSDDDGVVGGYATVFGHYEEEPQGWHTEEEKRQLAQEARKEARGERRMGYVLGVIVLGALLWLIYTIYALIAGVDGPLWERILALVTCVIILFVGCGTLYYSKK